MKAMAWISNWYKSVSAMTWMWVGFILIGLSTVLQTIAIYHPSNLLFTTAQGLAGFGIIFSIAQAYRSARDFEQERRKREAAEQNVLDQTEGGKERLRRSRLLNTMNKNSQE